jgi:drug/metabolite transporter (DMT)-like permease
MAGTILCSTGVPPFQFTRGQDKALDDRTQASRTPAFLVMLLVPLFFSSNVVLGRGVIDEVSPFILAAIRWSVVALLLAPFLIADRKRVRNAVARNAGLLLLLGFLGMFVCGAGVYLALRSTSATNGTLIYTTSPVIILLLEWMFLKRAISLRAGIGSLIAFIGVAAIVLRGDPTALLALDFNIGDLIFVVAAISWAGYSILYRSPSLAHMPNMSLLALLAAFGSALLVPAALVEYALGGTLPSSASAWGGIGGIILFASLLAYTGFQFGIRRLGAATAGAFMYLLPPCGVMLAVLFLGETLYPFHLVGIALVTVGIMLATAPAQWFGWRPA